MWATVSIPHTVLVIKTKGVCSSVKSREFSASQSDHPCFLFSYHNFLENIILFSCLYSAFYNIIVSCLTEAATQTLNPGQQKPHAGPGLQGEEEGLKRETNTKKHSRHNIHIYIYYTAKAGANRGHRVIQRQRSMQHEGLETCINIERERKRGRETQNNKEDWTHL